MIKYLMAFVLCLGLTSSADAIIRNRYVLVRPRPVYIHTYYPYYSSSPEYLNYQVYRYPFNPYYPYGQTYILTPFYPY